MHRLSLCVVVTFASALLGASASASHQARYLLRQRSAVGDRHFAESTSETSLTLTPRLDGQEGASTRSTTHYREQYVQEVLGVAGGAATRLRHTYQVSRLFTTDESGRQVSEKTGFQGKTVTFERKAGKLVIAPASLKLSAEERAGLAGELDQTRLSLLPDREVAVGEEWLLTTDLVKTVFPQTIKGTMTARFEEVTSYSGLDCARVHLSGELELRVEGLPVPVKARMSGDLYHSLRLHKLIAMELSGPLSVDAQLQQEGHTLILSGEGQMTARVTASWQRIAGKAVATAKPAARLIRPVAASTPRSVQYGEVSFNPPGPGWKIMEQNREAGRITVGKHQEGGMRGISLWPVEVPPAERSRSRAEHAASYFAFERQLERPDGPWTGFQQGERRIGTQIYATMTFQMHPNASAEHVMDGLFLVYFPRDFDQRHRYVVLMWSDLHLRSLPAQNPEELDRVVDSLRISSSPSGSGSR